MLQALAQPDGGSWPPRKGVPGSGLTPFVYYCIVM